MGEEIFMKWDKDDLKVYYKSKEYVDTVCIPLAPISYEKEEEAVKLSNQYQSLQLLSTELERNYVGRMMLSPLYTYKKDKNMEMEIKRMNQWIHDFQADFKHVFLLTFDVNWRKQEKDLDGQLIWLPATSIEAQPTELTKKWIQEQISQISELIQSYWD